ncbi:MULTISPECIES: DUF2207 domain-containing protein [Nocardiopsis]|uniref:Predicted membrane protein YciQ-like C-terminal domain-containing protein n=1 Tax=Nocardiopsis sinuspersici TaxID=501010 RepID=A0A1V3C5W6_9ACTN|nr:MULTISPECIES: DUF2207 domain-containing protein [Nocardiopsis]OOC55770.1 hypothetical protein NOSIN_19660 [Nocardiopsis sinuspersici]
MWWVGSWRPAVVVATAVFVLSSLVTGAAVAWPEGEARAATVAAAAPTVPGSPTAASGTRSDPVITNDIRLELDRSGTLRGEETISFSGGAPAVFTRAFTETMLYDTDHDREFEVVGVRATDLDGDTLDADVREEDGVLFVDVPTAGTEGAVLTYRVIGTVSEVAQGVQMEWRAVGAYSHTVQSTDVTVTAPLPPEALSCLAGEPRSAMYCTASDMGTDAGVAHFLQADMGPEDRLDIVVNYPSGTAEGEPILTRRWSLASAFAVTPATASVFGLLLVVLVGGLAVLIRVRGRDERALRKEAAAGEQAPVSEGEQGRLRFAPPDGVHAGQIGTLVNETVDITDLTGAVVDLAVRGYVRLEELPHENFTSVDWRLVRLDGPPDDTLLSYEWMLLDAVFGGRRTIRLSQVGSPRMSPDFPARIDRVREELYRDMVRMKWFARSPNQVRGRWSTIGMVVTAAGVVLTAALAMFTGAAFTGLAVVIAGAAVTAGAQYMPAKTALGSSVYAHTAGFRDYLLGPRSASAPPGQRVELYSRYLPYAVIFGDVDRWANILASAALTDLTPDELTGDGLAWYTGPREWRIEDFADSISTFAVTLTGIITNARRLRLLNQLQQR